MGKRARFVSLCPVTSNFPVRRVVAVADYTMIPVPAYIPIIVGTSLELNLVCK